MPLTPHYHAPPCLSDPFFYASLPGLSVSVPVVTQHRFIPTCTVNGLLLNDQYVPAPSVDIIPSHRPFHLHWDPCFLCKRMSMRLWRSPKKGGGRESASPLLTRSKLIGDSFDLCVTQPIVRNLSPISMLHAPPPAHSLYSKAGCRTRPSIVAIRPALHSTLIVTTYEQAFVKE